MDLTGVLFTLETGFADHKTFATCACHVLGTYLQKVQENKAMERKRTGNYCNTPLLNNITIIGLPKALVPT